MKANFMRFSFFTLVSSCCHLVICVGFLCFRYLATASSDHTVKIWNVDGFTLEKTLVGILLTCNLMDSQLIISYSHIDLMCYHLPIYSFFFFFGFLLLFRTSTVGVGLCFLCRWCLSYNRYLIVRKWDYLKLLPLAFPYSPLFVQLKKHKILFCFSLLFG